MNCIGLTGGIGSGKSLVAEIFVQLGIPVYKSDSRAKEISNENSSLRAGIISLFGHDAYIEGKLNNKLIGRKAFEDPALLGKLNSLIHPEVEKDFRAWCHEKLSYQYVIKEAAILFETGSYRQLHSNILVVAPEKTRIDRVMQRDGISEAEVVKRIKNQWPDEDKLKLANFVIDNDGNKMILPQVLRIHNQLIKI